MLDCFAGRQREIRTRYELNAAKTQFSCHGKFSKRSVCHISHVKRRPGCGGRASLFHVYVAFQTRLLLQDTLVLLEAAQSKSTPCKHVSINFLIYTYNNIPIDHAKIVI